MRRLYILLIALSVLSCKRENPTEQDFESVVFGATITTSVDDATMSKATVGKSGFVDGEQVSVWLSEGSVSADEMLNYVNGATFVYGAGTFAPQGMGITYTGPGVGYNMLALYPRVALADVKSGVLSLPIENQFSIDNFKKSDLLIGSLGKDVLKSGAKPSVDFKHVMSRLSVKINLDGGSVIPATYKGKAFVKVCANVHHKSRVSVNIATGAVALEGSSAYKKINMYPSAGTLVGTAGENNCYVSNRNGIEFEAVLGPCSVAAGSEMLELLLVYGSGADEEVIVLKYSPKAVATFVSGKSFVVNISSMDIDMKTIGADVDVTEWDNSGTETGGGMKPTTK